MPRSQRNPLPFPQQEQTRAGFVPPPRRRPFPQLSDVVGAKKIARLTDNSLGYTYKVLRGEKSFTTPAWSAVVDYIKEEGSRAEWAALAEVMHDECRTAGGAFTMLPDPTTLSTPAEEAADFSITAAAFMSQIMRDLSDGVLDEDEIKNALAMLGEHRRQVDEVEAALLDELAKLTAEARG